MIKILVPFNYREPKAVSYQQVLNNIDYGCNSITYCLEFFTQDYDCTILKLNGDYINSQEILLNDGRYTDKEIRASHNLRKLLLSGSLKWQKGDTK